MSREVRTVRPFPVPAALRDLLAGTVLHFGDLACRADDAVVVSDRDDFLRRHARIVWSPDQERFRRDLQRGLTELGLGPADTALLVQVRTRYLGLAQHLRFAVDDPDRLEPEVDLDRCELLRSANRGVRVSASLVLRRTLASGPRRPWRKGARLVQAEFELRTEWLGDLFRPVPLDGDLRRELDLPASAMRYVDLGDHDPLAPRGDIGEMPVFYVDEDVLARLHHWGSATGRAAQLQLVLDFVTAVVQRVSALLHERGDVPDWEDIKDSLLGRILRRAAGRTNSPERLLELVRDDPAKTVAHFEHELKLCKAYVEAIREAAACSTLS